MKLALKFVSHRSLAASSFDPDAIQELDVETSDFLEHCACDVDLDRGMNGYIDFIAAEPINLIFFWLQSEIRFLCDLLFG